MYPPHLEQSSVLSTLTQAPAGETKAFVETLLGELGQVEVLKNRTGLVMTPLRDTAQGALFHLGEVLVAEAHVRLAAQGAEEYAEGYAACLGRDLEQALAIALLDASLSAGVMVARIESFVAEQAEKQRRADETLLKQVEATRVEMETF